MTNRKAKEEKSGQMGHHMMGHTRMERNRDLANSFGQMEPNMMAPGRTTKCMARDSSSGLMAGHTKENIFMTRNRDMEYLNGQMEESMKAIGVMASRVAKASSYQRMVN